MKNTEDLISIIIPVYNVEKYIGRCIQSIQNQTYKNFEIILIDDNSPDRCPEICDDYSKKYSNISVVHLKNTSVGVSDARNIGVELAQGKLITFIDSDDSVHETLLEILKNAIDNEKVLISMCSYIRIYDSIHEVEFNYNDDRIDIVDDVKAMEILIDDQTTCAVWGKLYDKSLFDGVVFPSGKHNEDMFVTPIIYTKAKKIAVTSKKLYYYYQQGTSLSRAEFSYNMLDRIDAILFWKKHINLYYSNLIEKVDMHYFANIVNISQYLVTKTDDFGIKKYEEYKNEILRNYNYINNSKLTSRNNKIKLKLIKYNIFQIAIILMNSIKSKNDNKSI